MPKVKVRRKGFLDVEELDAISKLYSKGITKSDWRKFVLAPAVLMALFAFGLTHYVWVALACTLYGIIYGKKVIMKASIWREYELKSLNVRNQFLNSLTQVLTDDNKITLNALEVAQSRTSGELNEDLNILQAQLEGADKNQVSEAFQELGKKYERDILFCQYLEQLQISLVEGREGDIETMKKLKNYHNQTLSQTEDFINIKNGHFQIIKIIAGLLGLALILVNVSFSLELFHKAYARSVIGWVSSGIYYGVLLYLMKDFFKKYFDDDIMSIGKYRETKDVMKKQTEKEVKINGFLKKTKSFWLDLVGESNYEKLIEMNYSDNFIVKWQSTQMFIAIAILFVGILLYVALRNHGLLYIGVGGAFLYYVTRRTQINQLYLQYRFERQMEFTKFARLIIPHLKLKKNGGSLYQIFEKVLPKIDDEKGRILLMQLMNEMTDKPDDPAPFIEFAEKMSRTDKAALFMNTVFDLRRNGLDMSIIEEIDRLMSEDMMKTINQIMEYKISKIEMFGAKLTFSILILIFGVAIAFVTYEVSQIDFFNEPVAIMNSMILEKI